MNTYKLLIILLIQAMLIGCSHSPDSRFIEGTEIKDSLTNFRYVRDTTYDQLEIGSITQNIKKEDLVGYWEDSLTLYYDEGKWRAWVPIDKTNKLTLKKTSKYVWKEEFRYSKLDTVRTGQFWVSNYNDSSFLQLFFNNLRDTIFNQGDTGFLESFLIDYFVEDTMLIRAYQPSENITKDEAHLLIRKNL